MQTACGRLERRISRRAGITKRVTPHLRHASSPLFEAVDHRRYDEAETGVRSACLEPYQQGVAR